jgi:hypothetical protein
MARRKFEKNIALEEDYMLVLVLVLSLVLGDTHTMRTVTAKDPLA